MALRLRLLGSWTADGNGAPVTIRRRKARGLLAYLAVARDQRASREALAALLWGERGESQARASLRQELALIRRALDAVGPDLLITDSVAVSLAPAVTTDVGAFERLCGASTPAEWSAALEQYRGKFLADLTLREAGFEEWQLVERTRLHNLAVETLERLGRSQLDGGEAQAAVVSARKLLGLEPLRESGHRLLMAALAGIGQRSAAMAQYRECRRLLGEGLRVQPAPETQRLFEAIRGAPEVFAHEEARAESARAPESAPPERRQLTVMRCALVNATAMQVDLDVEDYQTLLTTRRSEAAAIVERYTGSVAQYTADGLVAYFGYPQAHEDDAERAVRAGLDVLGQLRRSDVDEPTSDCRIGIATGPVVVGPSPAGIPGGEVVGSAAGQAELLHQQADLTGVVISLATEALVSGAVISAPMDAPLVARRATSMSAGTSRFAARTATTLSPFVGREEELELLKRRWDKAKAGEAQVVLVTGEPGIGKSRLLQELREAIAGEPHEIFALQCSPYHESSALYPVITALEQALGFSADYSGAERLENLRRHLAGIGITNDRALALLSKLLSISPEGHFPEFERMDARQIREGTFSSLLEYVRARARTSPTLCAFEDLHWVDPTTKEWLSRLFASTEADRVLIVGTTRPRFEAAWEGAPAVASLTLASLGRRESERLARAAAGSSSPLTEEVLGTIIARATGNPLFIEELVRTAGLQPAGGTSLTSMVPSTLQDSLMARLDALRDGKRVAQHGAVVGREFSEELLTEIWDRSVDELSSGLSELKRSGLVQTRQDEHGARHVFKHALIRDASYNSMLLSDRQRFHARIGDSLSDIAGRAYHYARSAHREKAIGYALQAGDDAVRMHARPEATTHYGQALAIAQELPDSEDARRSQIDAIVKLASVGSSREDAERDAHNLGQAQAMAEALNDQPRLAQILYWRARLFYVGGDLRTALACAEQSLDIADRLDDEALAAWPVNLMGRLSFVLGDIPGASRLMTRSAEQMLALGDTTEEAAISGFAAVSLAHMGEFETAFTYAERGVVLAGDLQNPFTRAAALQYRGQTHAERGNWTMAVADLEESRRIAEEAGDAFRAYMSKCVLGYCHAMAGSPTQGCMLNGEALTFADQIGTTLFLGVLKANHAHCLVALGDYGGAERLCREALELADGEPQSKARAHHALARALHAQHCGAVEPADNAIREAIALDKALHYRPELARAFLSYARMFWHWGQLEEADRYLDESKAMFREMGMEWDYALAEQLREKWADAAVASVSTVETPSRRFGPGSTRNGA
jgi:DNA-binding SARP family transcriptional activator